MGRRGPFFLVEGGVDGLFEEAHGVALRENVERGWEGLGLQVQVLPS